MYNQFCESVNQKILISQYSNHLARTQTRLRTIWERLKWSDCFVFVSTLIEKENMTVTKSIV